MTILQDDIYEQILIRLDVRDLIRCTSVCKSWKSLISDPRFVIDHLNHTRNNNTNELGHRRIILSMLHFSHFQFGPDEWYFNFHGDCHLLGSSNGLVCVSVFDAALIVANPLTRHVQKIRNPRFPDIISSVLCWGFGYDSSIQDYKLIVGFLKSECRTCFQVLTLKSNIWKVVGEVNYSYASEIGTLCNGALHWFMNDQTQCKKVIISFDLSQDKLKEIPQPDDDATYQSCIRRSNFYMHISLGIIEECLCIFHQYLPPHTGWKMSTYNVKESWGMIGDDQKFKNDVVYCLRELKNDNSSYDKSLCHDIWMCRTLEIIGAPIFVQSLVSPLVHNHEGPKGKKPKRKKRIKNGKRNVKLIMGDPSSWTRSLMLSS